jgi:hypothetical protein
MFGIAGAALGGLGVIGQFTSSLMGASARRAQMQEQIRATEMEKARTVGIAAARTGASGVETGSTSAMSYLAGLGAEFDRTISLQHRAMRTEYTAGLLGAFGGLLGGAGGVANGLLALNPPAPGGAPPGGAPYTPRPLILPSLRGGW